jgi:NADH-quinone oxidoreductase subunit N
MNPFLLLQVNVPDISIWSIMPEVIVCLAGVVVMLVDAFAKPTQRWLTGGLSLAGLAGALIGTISLWISGATGSTSFNGMIVPDESRLGFTVIFLIVSALTVLVSMVWVESERLPAGEFHSLLMFATAGMMLMASGADLVIIFLGLDFIATMDGGFRRTDVSNESSLKYCMDLSRAFLARHRAFTAAPRSERPPAQQHL